MYSLLSLNKTAQIPDFFLNDSVNKTFLEDLQNTMLGIGEEKMRKQM